MLSVSVPVRLAHAITRRSSRSSPPRASPTASEPPRQSGVRKHLTNSSVPSVHIISIATTIYILHLNQSPCPHHPATPAPPPVTPPINGLTRNAHRVTTHEFIHKQSLISSNNVASMITLSVLHIPLFIPKFYQFAIFLFSVTGLSACVARLAHAPRLCLLAFQ